MNCENCSANIDLSKLSGCAIATAINEIGYDNIHMCANHEDLLNTFTDEELIDYIINNNDRLVLKIAEACLMSEVELNSSNEDYFRYMIHKLVTELCNDNV